MNESDQHVSLLQEIRDNQVKQTEAVVQAVKQIEESQRAYLDSRKKYDQSQEEYRQSQEAYRNNLPFHTIIMAVFLGIIAVCMMVSLILRLIGK